MWNVTSDITVTVAFDISCNFVTADSVTVGLGCMPFPLSHLVMSCNMLVYFNLFSLVFFVW